MTPSIGVDVSRETIQALEHYADLTIKWTKRINLIAKSTIDDVWNRHIIDSAQVYQYAPPFSSWVDIGSGGGFPGIVMAIIAQEHAPEATFTLVESDARKCTFLRTVSRELSLNISVQTQRIEEIAPLNADIVSARALGHLTDLLPLAHHHLNTNGTALFMKGRRHAEELLAVSDQWGFELCEYPSITDPSSRILSMKRISRVA